MASSKNPPYSANLEESGTSDQPVGLNDSSVPHYYGHRERMRMKFAKNGGEAFADYELLEMILFGCISRGDTKPTAKALLAEFGSLTGVFAAEAQALKRVPKVGEATAFHLRLLGAAFNSSARANVIEQPILSSWSSVIDYCTRAMAHERIEQFRILFLDKKNRLKADEVQQKGTIDHTPVYPREVVRRALELDSSAIILVHNHPSGDPTPSRADIDMTNLIIEKAGSMGITVHDHIIIGREGHTSMKGLQLI